MFPRGQVIVAQCGGFTLLCVNSRKNRNLCRENPLCSLILNK